MQCVRHHNEFRLRVVGHVCSGRRTVHRYDERSVRPLRRRGYATAAARYCAITGLRYAIVARAALPASKFCALPHRQNARRRCLASNDVQPWDGCDGGSVFMPILGHADLAQIRLEFRAIGGRVPGDRPAPLCELRTRLVAISCERSSKAAGPSGTQARRCDVSAVDQEIRPAKLATVAKSS